MLPVLFVFMNTGIAFYNGHASQAVFSGSAREVATTFTGQYKPYVEATGIFIVTSAGKIVKAVQSCTGSAQGPVYTNPALARHSGCGMIRGLSSSAPAIKPYRSY